jgi:hypothetical protein
MLDPHFDECYGRFDFSDGDLIADPNLKAHTATRLIRLADGVDNVAELLRAMLDQLPNNTDYDRPRAMLEGTLALQNKQLDDLTQLAGGVLMGMGTVNA